MIESLESRVFLSSAVTAAAATPPAGATIVTKAMVTKAATQARVGTITTVSAQAGVLGQAITFTATVRGPASAASPTGQVEFTRRGHVIAVADLSPATSTSARFAASSATFTIPAGGGSYAYYLGPNRVGAIYVPDVTFKASLSTAVFFVKSPAFTREGLLKLATVDGGGGTGITTGQTANVFYTGFRLGDGVIFDWSEKDGGTPLSYTVGNGQVVAGFDQGTVGMSAGETRVLIIPPSLGYGQTAQGTSIPAGATLVFIITMVSFS